MFSILLLTIASLITLPCLDTVLPIGEKELLAPKERWPAMERVADTLNIALLTSFGYADSTGAVPENVQVYQIVSCSDNTSMQNAFYLSLFLVRGVEGDRDESVWLVTSHNNTITARSLVAQLQTTCAATYLRACSLQQDGTVSIQQLQHNFDCDNDEFVNTDHLPAFVLSVNDDGTITDVMPEALPSTPDDAQQPE